MKGVGRIRDSYANLRQTQLAVSHVAGQDAHWPATCEQARVFRQKNKGYAEMVRDSMEGNTSLIMSVQVKNCPFCHYLIEKGYGCPHMVCGLCSKEFCCNCLGIWDYTHSCKSAVQKRDVELPVCTKHL